MIPFQKVVSYAHTQTLLAHRFQNNNNNSISEILKFAHTLFSTRTPIRVSCHVLIDALHAELEPGAPIDEHGGQVRFEAVIGSRLDREADALGATLFGEGNLWCVCV